MLDGATVTLRDLDFPAPLCPDAPLAQDEPTNNIRNKDSGAGLNLPTGP